MARAVTPIDRLQAALSRLDAELTAASDDSGASRLVLERHRVAAAIDRWHDGRWGRCCDCNGEIAHGQLLADATATLCAQCRPSG